MLCENPIRRVHKVISFLGQARESRRGWSHDLLRSVREARRASDYIDYQFFPFSDWEQSLFYVLRGEYESTEQVACRKMSEEEVPQPRLTRGP